jgi:hypothetical protein
MLSRLWLFYMSIGNVLYSRRVGCPGMLQVHRCSCHPMTHIHLSRLRLYLTSLSNIYESNNWKSRYAMHCCMNVSKPHFWLKLGKSSQKAKSCFLQWLKKQLPVMMSINIHGPCCKDGGNTKRRSPTDQKKSKLKPQQQFGNQFWVPPHIELVPEIT